MSGEAKVYVELLFTREMHLTDILPMLPRKNYSLYLLWSHRSLLKIPRTAITMSYDDSVVSMAVPISRM